MTPVHEHEITQYLQHEAGRVHVHHSLADIEAGLTFVPMTSQNDHRPRRTGPFLAIAASVVLVAGLALARQPSDRQQRSADLSAATPSSVASTATEPSTDATATAPLPTATAPLPTLQQVPLPAGGSFQGTIPTCTTTDSIVYQCIVTDFPADAKTSDMTGYSSIIVDDTSHVSGGCVSVSVDATKFTCYIGQAAVDHNVVSAGYLGDWAPPGYIAG